MNKIQWTRSNNNEYMAYSYINGEAVYFTVYSNGAYKGTRSRTVNGRNLFISGKSETVESAMDAVERTLTSMYNESKTEETKEVVKTVDVDVVIPTSVDKIEVNTVVVDEVKEEPEVINVVEDVIVNKIEGEPINIEEITVKETTEEVVCNDLQYTSENVEEGIKITLSSNNGTKIKYTVDGKEVANNSKIYKEPFVVNVGTIIKAKAFNDTKEAVGQLVITL